MFKLERSGVKSVVLSNKKDGQSRLGVSRNAASEIRDISGLNELASSFVNHKKKNASYLK